MRLTLFSFPTLVSVLAFTVFTACESSAPDVPEPRPTTNIDCTDSPEACDLTASNNAFGFNMFQRLHEETPEENIFISPLSIATALSMTINGAKGQTRENMMATLEQNGLTMEQVNEGFRQLMLLLPNLDPQVQVQIANSIWYREFFEVHQEFLETNETYYDSEVAALDFSDPAARDIINGWVKENTNGLIETIIDQPIPGDVVMYLINAIYFKGTWLREFDTDDTYETTFTLDDGTTTDVDMMSFGETFLDYFETPVFQSASLAYGDSTFAMSVFLPKEGYSVDDVVAGMNNDAWANWAESYNYTNMYFSMPRFEMEYEESLVKVLSQMGMGIAFSSACDLTGIADADLSISDVKHKSFISVDEAGTEAAAVTSVVIVESSAPQLPTMLLNRPFVFAIREIGTNNVLFVGKLMQPE